MDRFVAKLNIEHYCIRLRAETDARIRASLHRLMVEEEEKLGCDQEQLTQIEHEISKNARRIAEQQALISDLETKGVDATRAKVLLSMFRRTQSVYQKYRQQVLSGIGHNRLLTRGKDN